MERRCAWRSQCLTAQTRKSLTKWLRDAPGSRTRSGGRARWAHLAFSRINIELTIPKNQIEESLRFRREDASGGEAPGLSGPASVPGMDPAIVFADHGCCRSVRIRIPAPFTLSALFEAL